jgi:hypothetical protein
MANINIKIEKNFELSNQNIDDLVATALEGGINYWCGKAIVKNVPPEFEGKYEFASDVISLGGTLTLCDNESDDKWELTLEKLMNGIKYVIERFGFADADDLMDNHDADTADLIVQYALFNEIVFG